MCYTEFPCWIGNLDKRVRRGQPLPVVVEQVSGAVSRGTARGVARGGMRKIQCVCSPTIHPGSFRCRHHRADYKWVARRSNKA